mgnify:CR=1 FL=1
MDNKTIVKVINGLVDKIEELEKYPLKASNLMAKKLNNKIETLENKIETLENGNNYTRIEELECGMIKNENKIRVLNARNQKRADHIKILNDKYDILESKFYSLRSELDGIYSVLEMDALDIQALQDKVFNGFTRDQKDNVNLNKDDINKLMKEKVIKDVNINLNK